MIIEPLPNKRVEFFRFSPPRINLAYNPPSSPPSLCFMKILPLLTKRASWRNCEKSVSRSFMISFWSKPEALVTEHPLIDPWLRTKICIPGPSSIVARFLRHYLYLFATHARSARVRVHTHAYNIPARMNGAAGRRGTSLVSELGDLTTTCLIFPRAPERTSRIPMR